MFLLFISMFILVMAQPPFLLPFIYHGWLCFSFWSSFPSKRLRLVDLHFLIWSTLSNSKLLSSLINK